MSQKIDSIANGKGFPSFGDSPIEIQEKYNRKFQEVYEREMERQK